MIHTTGNHRWCSSVPEKSRRQRQEQTSRKERRNAAY